MQQPPAVPKTCDWVTARAECSLEQMFNLLRERIDGDVKTMQARTTDKIEIGKIDDRRFRVSVQWNIGGMVESDAVVFEHTYQDVIHVRNLRTETELFSAKPALNVAGDCQLEIVGSNGPALELWQVSRRALEPLFFRSRVR
jgi:hypothetical protein